MRHTDGVKSWHQASIQAKGQKRRNGRFVREDKSSSAATPPVPAVDLDGGVALAGSPLVRHDPSSMSEYQKAMDKLDYVAARDEPSVPSPKALETARLIIGAFEGKGLPMPRVSSSRWDWDEGVEEGVRLTWLGVGAADTLIIDVHPDGKTAEMQASQRGYAAPFAEEAKEDFDGASACEFYTEMLHRVPPEPPVFRAEEFVWSGKDALAKLDELEQRGDRGATGAAVAAGRSVVEAFDAEKLAIPLVASTAGGGVCLEWCEEEGNPLREYITIDIHPDGIGAEIAGWAGMDDIAATDEKAIDQFDSSQAVAYFKEVA